MCTTEDGTKQAKNVTTRYVDRQQFDAMESFKTDQRMYKQHDYRCLKPSKKKPPNKWSYYEMEGFRAAKSEEEPVSYTHLTLPTNREV